MAGFENDRLKAEVWISSQIRLCGRLLLPVYVVRKGDPDAGTILIKRVFGMSGCEVLAQARQADGSLSWVRATGPAPVLESDAEVYIKRQAGFDPDIWVIEIEDPNGIYEPDGNIF
ncbi:MAG: DUF1491 family protein [Rhodospirillales bacterium]|jgi:hypothetical protein